MSIHIAPGAGAPLVPVEEVRAVPGRGLEGDRYFAQTGTYSKRPGTGRAVTLIEDEALEALFDEAGIELAPGASRRNVVTRGVPLNHLVNREFCIGAVTLRGTRLCEPCTYLERLTQSGVRRALVHRGGLRAQILTDGVIHVGDTVREASGKVDEHDIEIAEMRRGEPTVPWEGLKAEMEAELADAEEEESDGQHVHRGV